jgi:hypothetical protein
LAGADAETFFEEAGEIGRVIIPNLLGNIDEAEVLIFHQQAGMIHPQPQDVVDGARAKHASEFGTQVGL